MSDEELLTRLIERGALPKYAFPTDVATFYVFDVGRSDKYRAVHEEAPSQGLAIALSQYAPGKEVWINSRKYRSGAIYSPYKGERKRMWERRQLYYECRNCHFAQTRPYAKGAVREILDCPACGAPASFGEAQIWIRPIGFAHPHFWDDDTLPDEPAEPSYATRAKLMAPGPTKESDWIQVSDRVRWHHFRQNLLITNRGPRDEGYDYCLFCGFIEPTALPNSRVTQPHPSPVPFSDTCPTRSVRNVVLGTTFRTDILLISIKVDPSISLYSGLPATDAALRTMAEALATAACNKLQLEPGEIRAEYRPALTDGGREGREAEVFLYDTLPGGAGFSRQIGESLKDILAGAQELLEHCPADCDRSCYRCLRSYKNKLEHSILDRYVGAGLLKYLSGADLPALPAVRVDESTRILFEDLKRQEYSGLQVQRHASVDVPGVGTIIAPILLTRSDGAQLIVAVSEPLCRDLPCDRTLVPARELGTIPLRPVNEMLVRLNLPAATLETLKLLGLG